MQIGTEIINPLADDQWDQRLAEHEDLTFFHSRAWAKVLAQTYRYQPVYVCTKDAGSITNLLPLMEVKSILTGKRAVSLPFTDYCEPILSDGLDLSNVLEEVRQYGRQNSWDSIQIRGGQIKDSPSEESFYVHELKLQTDTELLFKKLRSAKQRNIRKAEKQGIEIKHADDQKAVEAYYCLHCQTRKRHGMPPQPHRFFRNIFKYVIAAGKGKVILAQHDGQYIAGCVYFHFKDKAIYKFGASDMAYQHLRPNDLVMWEAIRWYADHGYRSFCFGRTALDNEGLRRFKSDWGTKERTINYYRYDLKKDNYVTAEATVKPSHKRIFQRLPVPALKLFGSMLYKHMG